MLILGDFNSHNVQWGSKNTEKNGKVIEEYLLKHNLVFLK